MSEKQDKDDSDNIYADPSPDQEHRRYSYKPPVNHFPNIDPPPKQTWQGAKIVDKSLWFRCDIGPLKVRLNPLVTIVSVLLILAFILWCTLAKDSKFIFKGFYRRGSCTFSSISEYGSYDTYLRYFLALIISVNEYRTQSTFKF